MAATPARSESPDRGPRTLDPLDRIRTEGGLAERLATLRWRLPPGGGSEAQEREGAAARSATVGLPMAQRWTTVTAGAIARAAPMVSSSRLPFG